MSENGNGFMLQVPITFNSVSVGKEQVSVGIGIDHGHVSRDAMGEMFVNRLLQVELVTGDMDARPLPGMDDDQVRISGGVTANSYNEKKASFGTRLAMPKGEAKPEEFWNLAGRSGWLTVRSSRAADGDEVGDAYDEDLDGQMEMPYQVAGESEDKERPKSVWDRVPDLDEVDRITIPIDDKLRHEATITVAPFQDGDWAAEWEWSGDGGRGALDFEGAKIRRRTREDAVTAAAGQLVDSIGNADQPKTKAATARRAKAIATCKTFYRDAEHGGQTILDTHPA